MSSKAVYNFSVFLSVNLPTRSKLREGGYKLSFDLNVFYFFVIVILCFAFVFGSKEESKHRPAAAELTRQYWLLLVFVT